MAKSKIIKELANKEITLEIAFNRLLIIAYDINNQDLITWASNELNGYPNNSVVPLYRQVGIGQIVYSGINGSFKITNQPLPYGAIDDKYIQILRENKISENISTLEKFASQSIDIQLGRDLTELAGVVYNNTGIQCANIYMKYSPETFSKILSNINTKLITVFLELDKQLGCLDELDIDTTDKRLVELEKKINVIIYKDNSITIGNENKLKNNLFQKLGGKK